MSSPNVSPFLGAARCGDALDECLRPEADGPTRAARLAVALHELWPAAPLCAVILGANAAAVDGSGAQRPEWAGPLREAAERRRAGADGTLSHNLDLSSHVLTWEEVRFRDRLYGALAAAVPADDAASAENAHAFLAVVAHDLGARLTVEALTEEAAQNVRLAEVGELSVPLAHEFNNFLNGLMLHLAVLQFKLPEAMELGLAEVRQQALDAAALIQQFQSYRRRAPQAPDAADLNRATRLAVAALGGDPEAPETWIRVSPGGGGSVRVRCLPRLCDGDLPVKGPPGDLKRLCVFLIRNAAGAAVAGGGEVVLQTAHAGGAVVLRVEDDGPAAAPETLTHLFEPTATARDGASSLELAACRTLARRLQGLIRAEARPQGGVAVAVEWADGGR